MSGLKMFLQVFTTASLFLGILRGVATVVVPILVTSDVDSVTCAGAIAIPNPRVCPGRSVMFECTTNGTGALVWRTSTVMGSVSYASIDDDVGAVDTLDGFTGTLTAEMDALLTATLTVTASDEVRGAEVTCLDSNILTADSESADMPLFVEAPPSPPQMVNAVSDSLDCSAGVENFIVSWQCPADTSGAAITNFTVSVDGGNPLMFVGTAEMSDAIPVALNEEHTFSVAASNCFGTGDPSSTSLTPQAPVPSPPTNVGAALNCGSMNLDTITVSWNDPNTNLRCPVTTTTVSAISADSSSSLTCSDTSGICTGNIMEGVTYTVTVGFTSDQPQSLSNPSTANDQITIRRFTVNIALRQMPHDCIEVTLEEGCEGDHGEYGVDVFYQDSTASSIMRFEQSDTICVPIVVGQTFSVRFYFDDDVVEQTDELIVGCSREGLTGDGVTVSPDQGSYLNGEEVIHGCKSGFDLSGPEQRTCQAGAWDPPLCMCKETTCKVAGLSTGEAVGISVVVSSLLAFSAGMIVTAMVAYCYISKQKRKYSPRDFQQPAPMYEEVPAQAGKIELQENVAYGPLSH